MIFAPTDEIADDLLELAALGVRLAVTTLTSPRALYIQFGVLCRLVCRTKPGTYAGLALVRRRKLLLYPPSSLVATSGAGS